MEVAQDNEEATLTQALCTAYAAGCALNWKKVFEGLGARPVDLPPYAFQRQRFWFTA
jgi:acyl transferase domain-containing protein